MAAGCKEGRCCARRHVREAGGSSGPGGWAARGGELPQEPTTAPRGPALLKCFCKASRGNRIVWLNHTTGNTAFRARRPARGSCRGEGAPRRFSTRCSPSTGCAGAELLAEPARGLSSPLGGGGRGALAADDLHEQDGGILGRSVGRDATSMAGAAPTWGKFCVRNSLKKSNP